jgi:hypothetical protein
MLSRRVLVGSSGRLDAVAFEVVEVERPQEFGDLTATRLCDVVDVLAQRLHVSLYLIQLSGAGLSGRQHLHQVPEETDVDVAACPAHRKVVQLGRGKPFERVFAAHVLTETTPSEGRRQAKVRREWARASRVASVIGRVGAGRVR